MMIIGLYTSRIILKTLGVEDYGTYNVVGGVVGMFSIVSSSMSTSFSRFITYEFGKNYDHRLRVRYGDNYMEFVKGASCHSSIFFDTENSFNEYI